METTDNDDLLQTALEHHTGGQLSEAEEIYRQIIARDSNHADALHLLGAVAAQRGQPEIALGYIERAIAIDASHPDYQNNKGLILANVGRLDEAIAAHQRAVELKPDFAEAHNNMGNALLAKGRPIEAAAAYRQTLKLRPDFANAHSNLGVALHKQGLYSEAIDAYRVALRYRPDHAEAHSNLGVALLESGQTDAAIDEYRQAIQLKPDYVDAHTNLGAAMHDLGREDDAFASLNEALRLNPNDPLAHYNLSLVYLLRGDYQNGWKEYDFRSGVIAAPKRFSQPAWDGRDLNGSSILVHAEQGFGDTIQFVRFVDRVAQRGGKVILQCREELIRLLKGTAGIDQIISKRDPIPTYQVQIPLLSLPRVFNVSLQDVPNKVPYVKLDPAWVPAWAHRMGGADRRLRVGLAWAGDPGHRNDRNRSIKLEQLVPLASAANAQFFSLQKGAGASQALSPPSGLELVDLTAQINDFADMAGLIANLDLVITVDTAVAHLAGAMAKPVWTLLPHVPDWRWLRDRDDSPWYPTMHLFRQTKPGDWPDVIKRVAAALIKERKPT